MESMFLMGSTCFLEGHRTTPAAVFALSFPAFRQHGDE
jgi:hypothetical protein